MYKLLKMLITFILLISIITISSGKTSAATFNKEELPSVDDLIETLTTEQSTDAKQALDQLESLGKEDLKKLEDILSDPDKLNEELNNPENQRVENVIVTYNHGELTKGIMPLADDLIATATVEKVMSLFSIDVIRYELKGKYTVNNAKTRIYSAESMDGIVTRTWVPVSTQKLSCDKSATSTKFTGKCTFSYDLGVGSWGTARIGVVRTGFTASPTEILDSYLYTE